MAALREGTNHMALKRFTYRLFLLLHARGHLRYGPVDDRELGDVGNVVGMVHGERFTGIQGPRSERQLTHGGYKALEKSPLKSPLEGSPVTLLYMHE